MSEKIKAICANCGKEFFMGWTGVSPNGIDLCDMCGIGYERQSYAAKQQAKSCLQIINVILFLAIVISFILLLSKWGVI